MWPAMNPLTPVIKTQEPLGKAAASNDMALIVGQLRYTRGTRLSTNTSIDTRKSELDEADRVASNFSMWLTYQLYTLPYPTQPSPHPPPLEQTTSKDSAVTCLNTGMPLLTQQAATKTHSPLSKLTGLVAFAITSGAAALTRLRVSCTRAGEQQKCLHKRSPRPKQKSFFRPSFVVFGHVDGRTKALVGE